MQHSEESETIKLAVAAYKLRRLCTVHAAYRRPKISAARPFIVTFSLSSSRFLMKPRLLRRCRRSGLGSFPRLSFVSTATHSNRLGAGPFEPIDTKTWDFTCWPHVQFDQAMCRKFCIAASNRSTDLRARLRVTF